MMGGASTQAQSLLKLIEHPENLRAHIDELHQANLARVKTSEDHRKAKAEAELAIEQLKTVQNDHDRREQDIANANAELETKNHQLALELAATKAKQQEFEQLKQKLEAERANHTQNVDRFITGIQAQQMSITQQKQDLQQKLLQMSQRHEELDKREMDIRSREQFILSVANEITRPR